MDLSKQADQKPVTIRVNSLWQHIFNNMNFLIFLIFFTEFSVRIYFSQCAMLIFFTEFSARI